MFYCKNCGQQINEEVKFCPSCGTPIEMAAPREKGQEQPAAPPAPAPEPVPVQPVQQPTAQQPLYAAQSVAPAVYQEEPISTGSYIGIFLLLMIPLVNLVCLIVWACGGCAKRNKTNLSRALLVWILIGTVLGGLFFLAGSLLFGDVFNEIMNVGKSITEMPTD